MSDYKKELEFGGAELEEEFTSLKKKYPDKVIPTWSFEKVTPVIGADDEEGEETEEQREKRLLDLLNQSSQSTWTSVRGRGKWRECRGRCCR